MALSAGTRQAAGMAASWLVAACAAAFSFVYFVEIKDMARQVVGLPVPAGIPDTASDRSHRQPETARAVSQGRSVEIKAGAHGHYFASAEINGRAISVLVDSGASIVALSFDDAARAGIHIRDSDYTQRVSTANGFARVAPVMLDRVSIGNITVRDVPASVSEPGSLATSLLGMSFLGRLQRVDMRAGVLLLEE
jgi:aspartyl protease family protein